MASEFDCKKLHDELVQLKKLKGKFKRAYKKGVKFGDLSGCAGIYTELKDRLTNPSHVFSELMEKSVAPELRELKLHEQYQNQVRIALESQLFEEYNNTIENGVPVIERNGKRYPMPSWREVKKILRENREIIREKSGQGFTVMMIVPFAYDLFKFAGTLTQKIDRLVRVGHENPDKCIVDAEYNKVSLPTPTVRDYSELNNYWNDANTLYYPKDYDALTGLSKDLAIEHYGAWQICFMEPSPVIERTAKDVGGRMPFDLAGTALKHGLVLNNPKIFKDALRRKKRAFKNPEAYKNETGFTAEQDLWRRFYHLLNGNTPVLADARSFDSYSAFTTETFNMVSNRVPQMSISDIAGDLQINFWDRDPYEEIDTSIGRTLVMVQ